MAINSSSFPALPSIASLSNLARPRPITLRFPRVSEARPDRKSTRLNSSHLGISYAVFCLKKKNVLFRSDRKSTRLNSSHLGISYTVLCLEFIRVLFRSDQKSTRLNFSHLVISDYVFYIA